MIRCCKKNYKKVIAIVIIVALGFVLCKDPINIKASENDTVAAVESVEEDNNSFSIDLEDGSYMKYNITDGKVTCEYYKYIGLDENGEPMYEVSESDVSVPDGSDNTVEKVKRSGTGPLYWHKVVKDRLKRDYFYQTGTKGEEMYYRIGGVQNYVINYSKINTTQYVDEYVTLLDEVNRQIMQCLVVAVGTVMVAIAAIIASYITAGASVCLKAISGILKKVGVTLVHITPLNFGQMVFALYDDYCEMEKKFAMAATYGIAEE